MQENVLATIASDWRYERALQGIRLLAQHHLGHLVQSLIAWRQHVNDDIKKNYSQNNVVNVQGVCKRVSSGRQQLQATHGSQQCSRSRTQCTLSAYQYTSINCGCEVLVICKVNNAGAAFHPVAPEWGMQASGLILCAAWTAVCAGCHGDIVSGSSNSGVGRVHTRLLERQALPDLL